jgi:hypothetical protein
LIVKPIETTGIALAENMRGLPASENYLLHGRMIGMTAIKKQAAQTQQSTQNRSITRCSGPFPRVCGGRDQKGPQLDAGLLIRLRKRVLRFLNGDVLANLDGAIEAIVQHPHPNLVSWQHHLTMNTNPGAADRLTSGPRCARPRGSEGRRAL